MRVILDTNVLISALLSPAGAPAQLLDAWERGAVALVACEALIAEVREVTGRPFFRARLRASSRNFSPPAFVTFRFSAWTYPPTQSRQIPRTATCLLWLKPAKQSFW